MTFLIYFVKNPIIVYIKLKLESVTVTSSNITLVVGNAPISPGISYLTQNSL